MDMNLDFLNEQGAHLEQEIYLDLDPVLTNGNNDLVCLGVELANKHFDHDIIKAPTVGGTDASNLLRDKGADFSFLMFGPGERPYAVYERVNKEIYLKTINYYIDLLTKYTSL
ncbi:hypothetical protein [Staphylococcus agnetis]|uniref:hypothetical protein n=1 Tax=Staphylococcus agnetis TaxID=985762 RepID=UPI001431494D|nr:hypothetical protein [Staphylococcus agnetis]MBY7665211.1 hypothetical protein [Staphylococcus agnetis]NJH85042.1 hypothetical protein [Staphylococcus agnetis]NJI16769.1 hypothetical protein [Staphylococcus agnetis]